MLNFEKLERGLFKFGALACQGNICLLPSNLCILPEVRSWKSDELGGEGGVWAIALLHPEMQRL